MADRYDAIIVGAGHNGLICAAYLAKAGKRVVVLEANDQVGGAAVTRSLGDDFKVSACAHLLYQLQPEVIKDLGLNIPMAATDVATVALAQDGNNIEYQNGRLSGNASAADTHALSKFHARMSRFATLLRTYINRPPPRLANGKNEDKLTLARLGMDVRRLGKVEMRAFLRLIGMNIYDELQEKFESKALQGALALDAVLGTHLGPRSPNTVLTYLYRLLGSGHGAVSIPAGGMGAVCDQLASKATAAGADIRTATPVKRIVVNNGRVSGVELADGESIESWLVVSNADPKTTIMDLVTPRHVETGFTRRIHHLRMRGNAAKLHLALDGLPAFTGLEKKDYGKRLLIAPDADYVERAFNPAKYGEFSPKPIMEITFPSFHDKSLAPIGKHVMSAIVQFVPYRLKQGWGVDSREQFLAVLMDTLSLYAPDIAKRVLASELLTPADIEEQFHIQGGHWHHGELTLDQFLFVRPVAGAAQYAMPVDGLYLCGAGAHPGGGVMGAAGRNAARMILNREKAA